MDVPRTEICFFKDDAGKAPVVDWLKSLRRKERKAYANSRPLATSYAGRWPITCRMAFMS